MQNGAMKAWLDSSYLAGANQSYIEQLYEDFLTDPGSVEDSWRSIFRQLPTAGVKPDQLHSQTRDYFRRLAKDSARYNTTITDPETDAKQVKVLQLKRLPLPRASACQPRSARPVAARASS